MTKIHIPVPVIFPTNEILETWQQYPVTFDRAHAASGILFLSNGRSSLKFIKIRHSSRIELFSSVFVKFNVNRDSEDLSIQNLNMDI